MNSEEPPNLASWYAYLAHEAEQSSCPGPQIDIIAPTVDRLGIAKLFISVEYFRIKNSTCHVPLEGN